MWVIEVHYTKLLFTTLLLTTTLHYTRLLLTTLLCTPPHYTTLHYTSLPLYTSLHHTTQYYTTLHYTVLYYTTLHKKYCISNQTWDSHQCDTIHPPILRHHHSRLYNTGCDGIALHGWMIATVARVGINHTRNGTTSLLDLTCASLRCLHSPWARNVPANSEATQGLGFKLHWG